jgi:hypothetical protein
MPASAPKRKSSAAAKTGNWLVVSAIGENRVNRAIGST